MDKYEIMRHCAKVAGITEADAFRYTEAFLECIKNEIAGGGMTIAGLGAFRIKVRAPKTIRPVNSLDPTAEVTTKPGIYVAFTPSEKLKDRIREKHPWNGNETKKS